MSYNKMTPQAFASNIQAALDTDAGGTIHEEMPTIEPRDTLMEMEATIAAMAITDKVQSSDRTPAPTTSREPATGAADEPTKTTIPVVGYAQPLVSLAPDSWGIVGTSVTLPNSLWGETDGASTPCVINHYVGKIRFGTQRTAYHAYVVSMEHDQGNYAIRADTIVQYHKRKRALSKLPQPRVLSK